MKQRLGAHPAIGFMIWIAVTGTAAVAGALASRNAAVFYAELAKPAWAPPASVFGPVWTVLYVLMAIAAWLVWRAQPQPGRRVALALYLAQLCANALWSWLFFAWHEGALAFVDVLVLVLLVTACLVAFWRVSRLAGCLMLPYLAWGAFASALTWAIWRGNPMLL